MARTLPQSCEGAETRLLKVDIARRLGGEQRRYVTAAGARVAAGAHDETNNVRLRFVGSETIAQRHRTVRTSEKSGGRGI